MNLPWDKYEYSEPFLVGTSLYRAKYFMWRRNQRTGEYALKSCSITQEVVTYDAIPPTAPNPIELLPPVLK